MPYLNHCQLMGHLARDPELKFGKSGTAFVTFTVAVSEGTGDNKTSHFFDCKGFGKTAEWFMESSPHKGSLVFLDGRLQVEKWEDKEGGKRQKIIVIADRLHNLEKGKRGGEAGEEPASVAVDNVASDIPF